MPKLQEPHPLSSMAFRARSLPGLRSNTQPQQESNNPANRNSPLPARSTPSIPNRQTSSTRNPNLQTLQPPSTSTEWYQQLLDEIRAGRLEQRKTREEVQKLGQILGKVREDYKKLNDRLKEQTDAAFNIESSLFKVHNFYSITSIVLYFNQ